MVTKRSLRAVAAQFLPMTSRWEFVHDEIGFNYRMPNINAALGCAQLEQLPRLVEAKRELYVRYAEAFAGMDEVRLFAEPSNARSNYWLQTLVIANGSPTARDAILEATNTAGLMTRPVWVLMHRLAGFLHAPRMALPVAEALSERLINIPSSAQLAIESAP
jgi:perosamine synthetase